jgi:hypothetical protein
MVDELFAKVVCLQNNVIPTQSKTIDDKQIL